MVALFIYWQHTPGSGSNPFLLPNVIQQHFKIKVTAGIRAGALKKVKTRGNSKDTGNT